jgi:hypothetical protein
VIQNQTLTADELGDPHSGQPFCDPDVRSGLPRRHERTRVVLRRLAMPAKYTLAITEPIDVLPISPQPEE